DARGTGAGSGAEPGAHGNPDPGTRGHRCGVCPREEGPMSHRVLVVDDEPDITALVAYHLARAGYRVSTASNGTEALKAVRTERPDVVVLDLMLPGTSGYDVLQELRRMDETRDVGVILLTS